MSAAEQRTERQEGRQEGQQHRRSEAAAEPQQIHLRQAQVNDRVVMGRPDVPQAQHHGMSEVQAEGMPGDKAHGHRKRPAPAAQRPQHEPRRKDVDQKVGTQRGCAE